MKRKTLLSAVIIGALVIPAVASAFRADNRTRVVPAPGGNFEVSENSRFGVPGQWCAAADYARRVAKADWRQRLFVVGKGQGRRGIVFGLDPNGATPSKITVVSRSADTPGAYFTVQRAYGFCVDQRASGFDR